MSPRKQVATAGRPGGAGSPTGVSLRAYARHRGVSHEAVRKALAAGRITVGPEGRIDPEAADREWDANTRPAPGLEASEDQAPRPFAQSRAVREHYRAELARIEYEARAGRLVDAEEVRAAAFTCARRARDLLLAMPDRVAPVVAGLADVPECRRVLEDEVRRALDELSRGLRAGGQ